MDALMDQLDNWNTVYLLPNGNQWVTMGYSYLPS
jgi:hypothetical protein